MRQIRKIGLILAAALAVVSFALPTMTASALEDASSALSIAPEKTYVINPGQTVHDKLVITNTDNSAPLTLSLSVIDFTYENSANDQDGTGGTPRLLLGPNQKPTPWSLKSAINLPQSVTIPAGSTRSIPYTVTMPKNTGPGSYYSAIDYATGAGTNGGQVGLSASVVTLVFVNVPGKVHEQLDLQKFGAYDVTSNSYEYFATQMPLNIGYTLKDAGNVVEAPTGSITLKGTFGPAITINNVNPNQSLALIGQTRTFLACIKTSNATVPGSSAKTNQCASPGLWPGLYKATIDLYYGQNGNVTQEILKTTHFWYLPWWFTLLSLAVIAVVAYYVWKIQRSIREKLAGPRLNRLGSSRRPTRRR